MLCDIESLSLSSAEALAVLLLDGDDLSAKGQFNEGGDRVGYLIDPSPIFELPAPEPPVPVDQLAPFL